MDNLTITGMIIAGVLVVSYIAISIIRRSDIQLIHALVLFLAGTGSITGVKIIIFAFNQDLVNLAKTQGIETPHVVLAGFAILWLSIVPAVELFRRIPVSKQDTSNEINSATQQGQSSTSNTSQENNP